MAARGQRKRERSRQQKTVLPESVITICQYGPNDKTITKVVVSYMNHPHGKLKAMMKWVGSNIAETAKFRREILDFIDSHHPRNIVLTTGVMGCPHEEVEDYPKGEVCPICPFWARRDRFATARPVILQLPDFAEGKKWPGAVD